MLVHSKAAKRYAKALFDLAVRSGELDSIRSDIDAILKLMQDAHEFARFLRDYMLPASARTRILSEIFSNRINTLTLRFIRLLEEKKRCGILDNICVSFANMHDEMLGMVKGQITSPLTLEPGDVRLITEYARTKTEGQLVLSTLIDPALLGGFKLRLGDVVYDASLAAQLHNLREKMISV